MTEPKRKPTQDYRGQRLEAAIGERIRAVRRGRGYSPEEFARKLAIRQWSEPWSKQTVYVAEQGRRMFRVRELAAIAAILEVPVSFLVGEDADGRLDPADAEALAVGRAALKAAREFGPIVRVRLPE